MYVKIYKFEHQYSTLNVKWSIYFCSLSVFTYGEELFTNANIKKTKQQTIYNKQIITCQYECICQS